VEELTLATETAIEEAAAEGARAAALEALDKQVALARLQQETAAEAEKWRAECEAAKRKGFKRVVLGTVIGFTVGAALGGTVLLFTKGFR
jgi:hypothetical protein